MRICFSSDFHGSDTLYGQLDTLLRRERPDLVILGGDMLADGENHDPTGTQATFVREYLAPRVETWKQAVPDLTVAFLMGNHDWLHSEAVIRAEQNAGRLVLLELQRPWTCRGISFIGCPFSPPTPHWVKDYERLDAVGDSVPDFGGTVWATCANGVSPVDAVEHFREQPSLAAELSTAAIPEQPWVLVAHAPPRDTKLDRLPNLDHPIGSQAVRRFVENHRPLCALHGHVHESPAVSGSYFDELGGVLCVNPGQSHERLHAVLFDTEQPRATLRHTVFS